MQPLFFFLNAVFEVWISRTILGTWCFVNAADVTNECLRCAICVLGVILKTHRDGLTVIKMAQANLLQNGSARNDVFLWIDEASSK